MVHCFHPSDSNKLQTHIFTCKMAFVCQIWLELLTSPGKCKWHEITLLNGQLQFWHELHEMYYLQRVCHFTFQHTSGGVPCSVLSGTSIRFCLESCFQMSKCSSFGEEFFNLDFSKYLATYYPYPQDSVVVN